MKIKDLPLPNLFKKNVPYDSLTPIQEKAINAGLLENKSLIACAPTASGKTLIATMAIANTLDKGKSIFLLPLRALANEKYNELKEFFKNTNYKIIKSSGKIDSPSLHLANYDILILTTEKMDALLRHNTPWIKEVKTLIIDEIHLLNDPSRGPTLEILLTLLKNLINPQIVGLSATIGNPNDIANWLNAKLIVDNWRPVELKQGISLNKKIEFY